MEGSFRYMDQIIKKLFVLHLQDQLFKFTILLKQNPTKTV